MLMPLDRSTRPASTLVRRSSQSFTGSLVRFSISPANSRTQADWRPSLPPHIDGVTQQDQAHLPFPDQIFQRGQVGALVSTKDIGESLGGNAQRVANGQPDAPFSQVQRQNPSGIGGQVNFIIDAPMIQSRQG